MQRRGDEHPVVLHGERIAQGRTQFAVVLDEQNAEAHAGCSAAAPTGGSASTGRVTSKLEPPPARSCNASSPPCARAMARQTARPTPAPGRVDASPVECTGARWKTSKMRERQSAGTP